jgi:hypothetical protein
MEFNCLDIQEVVGFDWDDGNILKNEIKHNLKWQTIEEIFFNEPLIIVEDFNHSNKDECRCLALGNIDNGTLVSVIFTKRENKIRVISARPISKKKRIFMKTIPTFKNQQDEINFWDKNDATEYFDMTKAKRVKLPNLKKSTKTISLRLPEDMLEKIKVQANALDIPYQSFIKMLLQKELHQAL